MRSTALRKMGRAKLAGIGLLAISAAWAQPAKTGTPATATTVIEQPDAQRTREEFHRLLGHYPPSLKNVLAIDSSLLRNEAFLAPYPGLANFLNSHPEVAHTPGFYVGPTIEPWQRQDNSTPAERLSSRLLEDLAIFAGFGMAIGLLTWLIRTVIDYRRWNRLSKTQADVHTKILDRFNSNDDLLAYIQSAAGSKFLESSPITLDSGPRALSAPLGRILWSVQAGLVLIAGGVGLAAVSSQVAYEAAQPIRALGILAIALGTGFVLSAAVSFVISRRLGLIDVGGGTGRFGTPGTPAQTTQG